MKIHTKKYFAISVAVVFIVIICTTSFFVSATNIRYTNPSMAETPRIPLFSLASGSFSTNGLSQSANVNSVLSPCLPDTLQLISSEELNLRTTDDIIGLSLNANSYCSERFVLMFSVDKTTTGLNDPDTFLIDAGFPYNVADQANKNQAAGDAFLTTLIFSKEGIIRNHMTPNNYLCRNTYDEGGTHFSYPGSNIGTEHQIYPHFINAESQRFNYQPSADEYLLSAFTDDIDALASASNIDSMLPLFFVTSDEKTDIFVKTEEGLSLFASKEMLGLNSKDGIDGLVVFDNGDNVFNCGDQILISLDRKSTSGKPADIYSITVDNKGRMHIEKFASAEDLGLDRDNVNALEVVNSNENYDLISFVKQHGIPKHKT